MSQLALDLGASAEPPTATPPTGRAARRPDRRPVPQPQQQPEEQPTIAADFTKWLSPEEIQRAQAYADEVVREIQRRPAFLRVAGAALTRQLRRYAAGLLLAGGKLLGLAERVEAAGAPEDEAPQAEAPTGAPPKRGSGRPRGPRAPGGPMPPLAMRARAVAQSEAPVPAAPRKQQPTPDEVLAKYRGLKPPQGAGRRA
ncbi:hypothetical protein [Sorangium sp. So ce388]|uniref:hypothetical protein n=1 Tax=Sorangium sp. So ce388 TaxID=3133309 RepID=UPI003F5BCEC7